MRGSWLWQNADTLAAVVTAIAALVALLYAHLQIIEARRAESEANRQRAVARDSASRLRQPQAFQSEPEAC
jgi:hypothetical protein